MIRSTNARTLLALFALMLAALGPAGALPLPRDILQRSASRPHEILSPRLVRGNPERREIALTFDDGPHAGKTEQLLSILRAAHVRATFFVVGKEVDAHPELVRQELADGHEIGNHTYSHLRLPALNAYQDAEEVMAGARAIERATGSRTRLFRPPGGEYDAQDVQLLKRLGCVMVLWTDDPGDWARPPAVVLERRILDGVDNGSIILLHDGIPETLQMLPDLLKKLKARGYRFVTASEMARHPGAHVAGGPCVAARRQP